MTETNTKTLADRLSEGRLPVTEGLRYAMILGDALRRMHDQGRAHGAIAPVNIELSANGVELTPAAYSPAATPYAAPEVLDGRPADARSDIFSFAAVLYEILTGRAAFHGSDRLEPAPTGSPAIDRLLTACFVREPAGRTQRMQKVMLDLKLLSVAATRAAAPTGARREAAAAEFLRSEIAQLESRINARMQAQDNSTAELMRAITESLQRQPQQTADLQASIMQVEARLVDRLQILDLKVADAQRTATEAMYRPPAEAGIPPAALSEIESRLTARIDATEHAAAEVQHATMEAVTGLRDQLAAVQVRFTEAQERSVAAEKNVEAASERLVTRVQQTVDIMTERIEHLETRVGAIEAQMTTKLDERAAQVDENVAAVRKQISELHDMVAEDLTNFEKHLHVQAAAMESARTAMAQTDDLVERVVEALESLQTTVLEHSEDRSFAVN